MNDDDDRIRREAHKLWEGEGRPDGRAERHWAEAREIIALKDSNDTTLKPLKETLDEPAESIVAVESLGDLPGLTDQGDETPAPSLEAARGIADEMPLVTDKDKKASKGKAKASGPKASTKKEKAASSKGGGDEKPKRKPKSA